MQSLSLYLVINPQAGSGKGKKTGQKIIQLLKEQKIDFQIYESAYQGHIAKIVAELADQVLQPFQRTLSVFPLLIILGGDGSLHEAVNVLYQKDPTIPIGYIPCGSGNDFARGAGISRNPETALSQILAASTPKEIPLVQFQSTKGTGYFFNNMGIGLDAAIVEKAATSPLKRWFNHFKLSSLSYISAFFSAFQNQQAFPITIKTDSSCYQFEHTLLFTLTNHPYFGGGVMVAPQAKIMNPYMELVLIEKPSFFTLCHLILLFGLRKQLSSPKVFHLKTKQLSIDCPTIQAIQTDGEILPKDPYHFELNMTVFALWVSSQTSN